MVDIGNYQTLQQIADVVFTITQVVQHGQMKEDQWS
jgi:hypothetical protein